MLVLGLETSCDETAAAVVEDGRRVLSDVVSTQVDIHRRWGGVVPELASRNHIVQVMPVIHEALTRAQKTLDDVDLIAVTSGPGLIGALLVGLQVAKGLSLATGKPFVGANHLEGHLLAIRLLEDAPEPPFLGLVVSGGHTSLYDVQAFGHYKLVGSTRDDAAGEAYDKTARILGLPYPGGQPIDELAKKGDPAAIRFPRALPGDNFDVSFSGLKTAVLHHVQKHGVPQGQALNDLCASFQEAVADVLSKKLVAAARRLGHRNLVLCGGVAANSRLRALCQQRAEERGLRMFLPPVRLCTDNGAMIAVAGYEAWRRGLRGDFRLAADPAWRM
ncbi:MULTISPECIES: tRNA (adenosine(37)-N6)-threonylcarbamoyltransferase complex transferase subunit TsaD [unclassified Myxococcus]|uniref:tRNA (adenosine(37)-N6)-threonylcarbamoyltransferase complex transferase subunit TsaD n=1 Tax=unclassified Myxococcus TaxID=2648731 RepID=UPI00157ADB96|nr:MULTISPECIES: tRNA (adenosine(37)-N6)-threonylcarbamoyltransferase complex transferase subunit TsaD [unclassified Myxococcus]NTX08153.1 tRNA (adenosine(37)-N6)-threonylcarbamoyltransferase complex transferase subunit TsaD [Myxococcus sp. CA040A]NTX17778.1 tRNA (adenosine(37)-N6)-threonylcarbamoyltransferase complex transferase subunit TsaD [Myxococcus sp. CA056]NTX39915.1 tRNA (adenosine(37)-N6)-threonylcarbamoyltransferase complex transferase subunit TsaD [Myxococcus sp. CA033]